jgi:hypothetical protein
MGKSRLSGRPLLTEGKRTRKIDARFTEEEYRQVEEMEKVLGMKKTDLVRRRLLDNNSSVVVNAKALLVRLDAIGLELGRAGNNINQLARHANRLQKRGIIAPQVALQFRTLLEDYNRQQLDIESVFRQLLRALKH